MAPRLAWALAASATATTVAAQGARGVPVTLLNLTQATGGTAPDFCLNFQELWVFNSDGQLLAPATGNGVVASAPVIAPGFNSTLAGATDFGFGISGGFGQNPYTAWGASGGGISAGFHSGQCVLNASFALRFPASALSQVMLITRQDGTAAIVNRPVTNRYNVTTRAANGTAIESATLWSNATVVVRSLSTPFNPPVLPDPNSPAQLAGRDAWVRYVRITLPATQFLHFRELFVFDASLTNVARGKACSMSGGVRTSTQAGVGTTGCDRAVDHVVDFDNTGEGLGLFHHISSSAGQWAEWDLGGVYDVRRIVIFNRWRSIWTGGTATGGTEGARIAGAVVTLRNHWNETLATYTLTTAQPFFSIPVALTFSPSAAPSAAPTPSNSATPSLTPGVEASPTGSPSVSASPMPTGAAGLAAAVRVSSLGGPAPLPVVEVWAFSTAGRLVSAAGAFATATSSGPASENPGAVTDVCGDGYVYAGVPACPFYESAGVAPASVTVTFAAPTELSTIWLANRMPAPFNARIVAARTLLEVLDAGGNTLAAWNVTSSASYSTFTLAPGAWPLMPDLSVDFQTSPDNQAALVRYITITGCASTTTCFVHFRELACFDDVFNNVCAGKPTFGSAQFAGDIGVGGFYFSSSGVNMAIGDLDAAQGDLTHSINAGPTATWGVDLGGVYNVRRLVLWNRGALATAARLSGATLRLLNAFNATVGQITLTDRMVQSYAVTLFPPSATPTPSPTATGTPTPSPTGTGSPSQTASATASLSPGASPSNTASPSSTASNTATSSRTPPATPSATGSPLSPLAGSLRIQLSQPVNLNFIEMIVLNTAGAVISHPSAGAVATSSSVFSALTPPLRGQDIMIDPFGGTNVSTLFHTASTAVVGEFWQVVFPPQDVARVIFVNRGDGTNLNLRVTLGQGVITLRANNGTELGRYTPNGNLVQVWDVAPLPALAASPDPAAPGQTETQSQLLKARFLVIYVPIGGVYAFREVQVLDAGLKVISAGKPGSVADNGAGTGTAAAGTNGLLTYDVNSLAPNATNDLVLVNASGLSQLGEYRLDLGGLYGASDLAGVWLWSHRFRLPPAGTRLELQNAFSQTVFNYSLSTARGAEFVNVAALGGLYPGSDSPSPSVTPSSTASPSQTRTSTPSPSTTSTGTRTPTGTATPSATGTSSVSATASLTASPSATLSSGASPSITPSPAPTNPVAARITLGNGACLNFNELLVFDTTGRLISLNASGATVAFNIPSFSATLNVWQGNDFCFDMGATGAPTAPCQLAHAACNASGLSGEPSGITTYTLTFPPSPEWPGGEPRPVGSVIFVNRVDTTNLPVMARVTAGRGNVTLLRVDGSVAAAGALGAGQGTTLQVAPITLPPVPHPDTDPSVSEADKQTKVRYVRLASTAANFLHFKELMVWDADLRNVALGKPATGSPQYALEPQNPFAVAHGNDGIVDSDAAPMNLFHSFAAPGFFEVDLQGMFTPTRVTVFNRYSVPARLAGASLTLLNHYRAAVGNVTFAGGQVESRAVTLYPPSPSVTPSATPTSSATPSQTGTGSGSPSRTGTASPSATASPTASLTSGGTPSITSSSSSTGSNTPSASVTASVTPSATRTPTGSPSATPTPLSTLPSNVRIDMPFGTSSSACLNFQELYAWDADFRFVTPRAAGGVARMSNVYLNLGADNGIDLAVNGNHTHGACPAPATGTWWDVTFPPAALASVVFVNRMDGGWNTRIVSGLGSLSVTRQNGSFALPPTPLGLGWVQQFSLGVPLNPPPAMPAGDGDQSSPTALLLRPRFVSLVAPPGVNLTLREVFVLDATLRNVAYGRPVATTGTVLRGGGGQIVDGALDYDTPIASATSQLALGGAPGVVNSATIDLGALWTLSSVTVFWDRFALPAAGAFPTLRVLNSAGDIIYSAHLGGWSTQGAVSVGNMTFTAPSATASVTASPSTTATATTSSSNTASSSRTASNTATSTLTRSPSNTLSAAATRSRTTTPSITPSASGTGSNTPSASLTASATGSRTGSRTASPTPTGTGSPSQTASATLTPTRSRTGTRTQSPSATASVSASGSETASVSASQTGTPSTSATNTGTPSPSHTETGTPSASGSGTPASTPSSSRAPSQSATKSRLPSSSRTRSGSPTRTRSATPTRSRTVTRTKTRTKTRTPSKKKRVLLA